MKELRIYTLVLALISPIIALFVAILSARIFNYKGVLNILIIALSILLSLINSSKFIEGDLLFYLKSFKMAGDYGFLEYLLISMKDPAYYSFKFLFYNLVSKDFSLYLFTISFIAYGFLLKGVENFSTLMVSDKLVTLSALILTAFFPQIFSFSAHLVRQFVAVALGFYGLSMTYSNRNSIALPIIMLSVLFHSSNAIFLLLMFFKTPLKSILRHLLILVILILGVSIKYGFVLSGMERLKNLGGGGAILESVSMQPVVIAIFFTVSSILVVARNRKNTQVKPFVLTSIFLNIVFLLLFIQNFSELSNRILPVVYVFWPLVLLLLLEQLRLTKQTIFLNIVTMVMFTISLERGIWQYDYLALIVFPIIEIF